MSEKWQLHISRLQSQIQDLKGQITELKETLRLIDGSVGEQCDLLEKRTKELRASLEQGEGNPQYQLPPVLRILNNPDVGALLIGQDGRYLLFNAMAERILGPALKGTFGLANSGDHSVYFFDKTTPCEGSKLPWQECAAGKATQEVLLFVRRSDVVDGIWIRTISVPVCDEEGKPNGAVAFLLDTTEHIVVEEQVNALLRTLQEHLQSIEKAHDLMVQLTDKLSKHQINVDITDLKETPAGDEATSDFSPSLSGPYPAVELVGVLPAELDEKPAISGKEPAEPVEAEEKSKKIDEVIAEAILAAKAAAEKQEANDGNGNGSKTHHSSKVTSVTGKSSQAPASAPTNGDSMVVSGDFAAINRRNRQLANRVLVVDDISVNQRLLKLQMRRLGFEVETASNGKEAVDLVVQNDYDIVFMDLDMPMMDGPTATAAIREIEAVTLKYVPIVAVTSYERDIDRQRCAKSGMDDYLVKGANRKQLIDVINKYVKATDYVDDGPELTAMGAPEVDASIDVNGLRSLQGNEEMQEVFRLFYSSVNTFVECLQLAIDEKKSDAVTHFAHCIKGPAASLGLTQLSDILVKMIEAAESGNWTQVTYQYKHLKSNYSQVVGRLRDMFGPGQLAPVAR
jgi:CheY-like chemotaxis protein/HPt (histidine-containing phosphotransfer) domain-containing protein/PAS domain-containing protein